MRTQWMNVNASKGLGRMGLLWKTSERTWDDVVINRVYGLSCMLQTTKAFNAVEEFLEQLGNSELTEALHEDREQYATEE